MLSDQLVFFIHSRTYILLLISVLKHAFSLEILKFLSNHFGVNVKEIWIICLGSGSFWEMYKPAPGTLALNVGRIRDRAFFSRNYDITNFGEVISYSKSF